jgi:hypothetical protein
VAVFREPRSTVTHVLSSSGPGPLKFNTKTASPLPCTTNTGKSIPNCYLQVNKYIRCDQMPVVAAVTPATPDTSSIDKDKLGRQLFYEPHVFFSPVLASQRVVEGRHGQNSLNYNDNQSNKSSTTPPKKRLMTAQGVDALTQQLDAMCLGGAAAAAPIAATTAPVAATKAHVADANSHVVAANSHVAAANDHVVAAKAHVAAINSHVAAANSRVVAANAHVAAANNHVRAANNHVAAANAPVSAAATAVATTAATVVTAAAAVAAAATIVAATATKKKEQETAPVSPKSVAFETDIGRFEQSFYSPKSHCQVTVKRSCRLAELGTK